MKNVLFAVIHILAIVAFISTLIFFSSYNVGQFYATNTSFADSLTFQNTTEAAKIPTIAFAFIYISGTNDSFTHPNSLFIIAIESLRKIAPFTGPIFVFTDAVSCLESKLQEFHPIEFIPVETPSHPFEVKLWKMRSWELIKDRLSGNLDILVYLDADITTVGPLDAFFQVILTKQFTLAMFADAGKGKEHFHGNHSNEKGLREMPS